MGDPASASRDVIVSRAKQLASEICDTLNWQSERCHEIQKQQPEISPEDRVSFSAALLGDRIERFCGYLGELGLTADATSIAEKAAQFRHAVWQRTLTNTSPRSSPDEIEWAQEFYGPFPSPPETEDERELHELRGIAISGQAVLLCEHVLSVKQTLLEESATSTQVITFAQIAKLAGVVVHTVATAASDWRKTGHTINNPCSYVTVQPLCAAKWKRKALNFPSDYGDMKAILEKLE